MRSSTVVTASLATMVRMQRQLLIASCTTAVLSHAPTIRVIQNSSQARQPVTRLALLEPDLEGPGDAIP